MLAAYHQLLGRAPAGRALSHGLSHGIVSHLHGLLVLTAVVVVVVVLPAADGQVMRDRETGSSRGYGFVTFASSSVAQQAMQALHGAALPGPFQLRPLRVSPSNKAK
jgi:hypothetical protein